MRRKSFAMAMAMLLPVCGGASAAAVEQPSVMRLSVATPAPEAFVAFCQRQPRECGLQPETAARTLDALEGQRREMQRQTWQMAFAAGRQTAAWYRPTSATSTPAKRDRALDLASSRAEEPRWYAQSSKDQTVLAVEPQPSSSPAQETPEAGAQLEAAGGKLELAGSAMALDTTVGASISQGQAPTAQEVAQIDLSHALPMTKDLWRQMKRVNNRINGTLVRRSDFATFGVSDYWDMPLEAGRSAGDCEDYVLEKRSALLAAGVASNFLSIAVVETSWGETHAVLIVSTTAGEYVMDNLSPWILPWSKANYRWRARQTPSGVFNWALIASAS
jgi:predicted transglutaminase-like cysteine proteinase